MTTKSLGARSWSGHPGTICKWLHIQDPIFRWNDLRVNKRCQHTCKDGHTELQGLGEVIGVIGGLGAHRGFHRGVPLQVLEHSLWFHTCPRSEGSLVIMEMVLWNEGLLNLCFKGTIPEVEIPTVRSTHVSLPQGPLLARWQKKKVSWVTINVESFTCQDTFLLELLANIAWLCWSIRGLYSISYI